MNKFKQFLQRHVGHGEVKRIAHVAGLHPNSVYCWAKGRNQPNVVSLIWFLRAVSREKGLVYEQLWLEYIYLLQGDKDAHKKSQRWIQSEEHQDQKGDDESQS